MRGIRWDDPQPPFDLDDMMRLMRKVTYRPRRFQHMPVRASLYYAHRRRWLAELLAISLGWYDVTPRR